MCHNLHLHYTVNNGCELHVYLPKLWKWNFTACNPKENMDTVNKYYNDLGFRNFITTCCSVLSVIALLCVIIMACRPLGVKPMDDHTRLMERINELNNTIMSITQIPTVVSTNITNKLFTLTVTQNNITKTLFNAEKHEVFFAVFILLGLTAIHPFVGISMIILWIFYGFIFLLK